MTPKSITLLHASTGLLPSYGRVAVQGESQTAWTLCISATFRRNTLRQTDKACVSRWLPMFPTRQRDRKGRSQSHAQPTVAKNATVRTNLARSFCSIFKSLAWASEANRIGIQERSRNEGDIAGDQL